MKKTTITIVMATLCLIFNTKAQENKVIDVTSKGIQVGQKVPDVTLTNLHNYKDANGKSTASAKLSDFKGKWLILDFWATWCIPCVAMIPKMDSLQKQFAGKIQFISVTHQQENDVLPFLAKYEQQKNKQYNLTILTSDKALRQLFPHIYLPHYVWIDTTGTVRAITGAEALNSENISQTLKDIQGFKFKQKTDYSLAYSDQEPFLMNGNGGDVNALLFHSVLTGHQLGLPPQYTTVKGEMIPGIRVTFLNVTIPQLFAYAMGGNKGAYTFKNMKFQVKDQSALLMTGDINTWVAKHTYCYELIIPKSMEADKYNIMLNDLKRMFPTYQLAVEKTKQNVLALTRSAATYKIKSKGGVPLAKFSPLGFELRNFPLNRLVAQLSMVYLQNHPLSITDDTGYTERVDLKVDAPLTDIEALNAGLKPYGLALQVKEKEVEVLVFKDK